MLSRKLRLCAGLAGSALLAGCTTFPPQQAHVIEINKNAGDYANQATLLNIIRAEHFEPLTFVAVTGLDGTNSLTGSLGFAGFNLGPHLHASPRSFLLGPDSVSRTGSNTFHVSVIDDPASFVSLLSPVNPAIIAFFINQGYPRELLFFLLIDHMRVTPASPADSPAIVLWNNPSNDGQFKAFGEKLISLLQLGLTAEADISAAPSGRSFPKSALCFDNSLPPPAFEGRSPPAQGLGSDTCAGANVSWIEAKANGSGSGSGGSGGGSGDAASGSAPAQQAPAMVAGPDGALWVYVSSSNTLRHIAADGKLLAEYTVPPATAKPTQPPVTSFTIVSAEARYEISLRSTYGVYSYIGALRRKPTDITNLLGTDAAKYGGIVNISDTGSDCFTSVEYAGHHCIPTAAGNTKRLINLLHQLQEVSTAPANSPTTLTVTTVP